MFWNKLLLTLMSSLLLLPCRYWHDNVLYLRHHETSLYFNAGSLSFLLHSDLWVAFDSCWLWSEHPYRWFLQHFCAFLPAQQLGLTKGSSCQTNLTAFFITAIINKRNVSDPICLGFRSASDVLLHSLCFWRPTFSCKVSRKTAAGNAATKSTRWKGS